MRVLVLGSGAREHALVARLASERDCGDIVAAPGNPGIARLARTVPIDLADPEAARSLAEREQIDFTVVGPELPLSLGIADRFDADGRLLFGPTAAAAQLESSKAFAKSVHGPPPHSNGAVPRVRIAGGSDRGGASRRVRISSRSEGRRSRRRQRRRDRRGPRVRGARDRRGDARSEVRCGGRTAGDRGMSQGGRRSPSSRFATARALFRSARRRITSERSTTTVGRTRAGWAPSLPAH